MSGLLNGKQLKDGSVPASKLEEVYLPVEGGTINGDLTVSGDVGAGSFTEGGEFLIDKYALKTEIPTALKNPEAITFTGSVNETYDGSEEVTIYIPEEQVLTAGDNVTISDDHVISSYTPIALSDEVLTYDAAGLKANLSVVKDGNSIRIEGKTGPDGEPVLIGEFNVLQSRIVDQAEIVDSHLFLTLIVDSEPGKEIVDIDLSEFIDRYVGSAYVDIEEHTVSLKYDELHDRLIEDGMARIPDIPTDYVDLSSDQRINGHKTFNDTTYTASLIPRLTTTYSLGTNGNRFVNEYISGNIYGGKGSADDGENGYILTSSGTVHLEGDTPSIYFYLADSAIANTHLYCDSNRSLTLVGTFKPLLSNTYNLGTSTERWANIYSSTLSATGNIISGGNLAVTGSIKKGGVEVATIEDLPADYVNIEDRQTIIGQKTFDDYLIVKGSIYGKANIFSGDRTSASDENEGVVLTPTGNVHASGNIYTNGRSSVLDLLPGITMGRYGIYYRGDIPEIRTYFGNAEEYTNRFVENYKGIYSISNKLYVGNGSVRTEDMSHAFFVNGSANISGTLVGQHILPAVTGSYNIGDQTRKYSNIYLQHAIYTGNKTPNDGGISGGVLGRDGLLHLFSDPDSYDGINFYYNNSPTVTCQFYEVNAGILAATGVLNIGTLSSVINSDKAYRLYVAGNANVTGNLKVTGRMISDNIYRVDVSNATSNWSRGIAVTNGDDYISTLTTYGTLEQIADNTFTYMKMGPGDYNSGQGIYISPTGKVSIGPSSFNTNYIFDVNGVARIREGLNVIGDTNITGKINIIGRAISNSTYHIDIANVTSSWARGMAVLNGDNYVSTIITYGTLGQIANNTFTYMKIGPGSYNSGQGVHISPTGRVSIGTSLFNANYIFDVSGAARVQGDLSITGSIVFNNRPTVNGVEVALVTDVSTTSPAQANILTSQHEIVSNLSKLNLGEITDLRCINADRKTGTLKITGGIDGKEYRYSILNNGEANLKLKLPEEQREWIIPSGEVGILKIYCLFDKYVLRIE